MEEEEATTMRRIDSSFGSHDDLTELCFLLDEERKQMSELAEQWKAFGTHAIRTLTSQLADYRKKLSELEQRQVSLFGESHALSKQTSRQPRSRTIRFSVERSQPIYDRLRRTKVSVGPNISVRTPFDDSLEQQISMENIFDAIRTVEVYESIGKLTDQREKQLLRQFCHFVWKYLADRPQPSAMNDRSIKLLNAQRERLFSSA